MLQPELYQKIGPPPVSCTMAADGVDDPPQWSQVMLLKEALRLERMMLKMNKDLLDFLKMAHQFAEELRSTNCDPRQRQ